MCVEKWWGEYECIRPLDATLADETATALAAENILHIVRGDKSVWCGPWWLLGDDKDPLGEELINTPFPLFADETDEIVLPLANELKLEGTLDETNCREKRRKSRKEQEKREKKIGC